MLAHRRCLLPFTAPLLAGALLLVLAAAPAPGQLLERSEPVPGGSVSPPSSLRAPDASPAPEEKAAFIQQYDDGSVEAFYSAGSDTWQVAMLFDDIGADISFDAVEVCLRQSGGDPAMRFEVVIWDADGPGGAPGTELATFAAHATGVTTGASFDTYSIDFTTPGDDFYVGVRWNPVVDPAFSICVDQNGPDLQPGYQQFNESGNWSLITDSPVFSDYKAFMIRGFFSTPGVVAENHYVPFFLVDAASGSGTTTLFAIRNLLDTSTSVDVEYNEVDGTIQRTETLNLGPRDTETVNLRDIPGLAVDPDGFARGWVRLTTAGFPDGTPVLAGDYMQVDVTNNFATGEQMPVDGDICSHVSTRFLDFGAGTRLGVFVFNPRGGTPALDPPSFTVQAYDEAGGPLGMSQPYWTADHAVELAASDFTGAGFGNLVFDFTNAGGGYVFAEYEAGGRFSVGIGSKCEER